MSYTTKEVHWLLWPVWALWRLVAIIFEMTGRLVAMVLGLVFILVGALLCVTIIGAIVGVPLVVIGAMLLLRGMF
jgi:hypothetical protein